VGKIAKKLSEGARFLLIQHSKYSAMLSILERDFSAILPTGNTVRMIKGWFSS